MAKGQQRSNREIRKPKQEKAPKTGAGSGKVVKAAAPSRNAKALNRKH